MKEPAISFSPWVAWDQRTMVEGKEKPGAYLLGRFPDGPPAGGAADPRSPSVVYIGETHGHKRSLAARWHLFGRAAFGRGSGHSGGIKYAELYGQDARALYVSAFPVSLPEPHGSAFIIYAERRLIWEYVLANGQRPPCNSE